MKCLINQRAKLFWAVSIKEGDCHAYEKTGSDLQLMANHPVFQFEASFFQSPSFFCA